VTRPELWETKISRPATLDECIGDLSSTENRLPDRRSTKPLRGGRCGVSNHPHPRFLANPAICPDHDDLRNRLPTFAPSSLSLQSDIISAKGVCTPIPMAARLLITFTESGLLVNGRIRSRIWFAMLQTSTPGSSESRNSIPAGN
jgi:hypothetical protein